MPGVINHLIAGSILCVIGRILFRAYFEGDQKLKKDILLAVVCLLFSILPDFFLGIYYLLHLEQKSVLMGYQTFTHHIFTPVVIVLFLPIILLDKKRRPLWIMAAVALILHIIMDLYIGETNFLW